MEQTLFIVFIILIVLHNLFHFFADALNDKARTRPVPENVKDVYDTEGYKKWLAYSQEKSRLGLIQGVITFVFVVAMILFGGFAWLAEWSRGLTESAVLETLIFLGVLFALATVFNLPFKYYDTFSIENRYGFNRATKKTFVTDRIKGIILTVLFGGGLLAAVTAIFTSIEGGLALPIVFGVLLVVFLFINVTLVPVWLPLFNKLTPLEDGDLKQRIEDFAKSQQYEIRKISVMDASRRSSKLNAFFSGFGRFKNVVLFDTLLEKLSDDEVLAVLAHEIAHAKHKDVLRNIILSMVNFAILLGLFYAFIAIDVVQASFGLEGATHIGFMLLLFMVVFGPVSTLIGIANNAFSRKAEFKADRFAAKHIDKTAMQTSLKVLSRENFSQLTPHPLYVFLYYSHPPVNERISAIESV